jgi:hypothetical protein
MIVAVRPRKRTVALTNCVRVGQFLSYALCAQAAETLISMGKKPRGHDFASAAVPSAQRPKNELSDSLPMLMICAHCNWDCVGAAFVVSDGIAAINPVHNSLARCPHCGGWNIIDLTQVGSLRLPTMNEQTAIDRDRRCQSYAKTCKRHGANFNRPTPPPFAQANSPQAFAGRRPR